MMSDNAEDCDLSLPTPEDISENTDHDISREERQHNENLYKLKTYVELMAYRQVKPVKASPYTEFLAKPKKNTLEDNAKQFSGIMAPSSRGERLKRLAEKHSTITAEHLEKVIRSAKANERRKKDVLKRKEEVYYELLKKLELQCQTQYLNLVLKKFGNFIAKLSTTMCLPPRLIDPYARMQRGLFCNILQRIGIEKCEQDAIYYNTKEGSEYIVCHKLSHALLSLIIKALDLASTRNPDVETSHVDGEYIMDKYIEDRLLRAAEKKILFSKRDKRRQFEDESLNKQI